MNSRRRARELALRALYAEEMTGNTVSDIIQDMIFEHDAEDKVKQFAEELVKATVKNKEEADRFIAGKAFNWDFQRIAVLDKLILRLAICELLYFEDIPPKVSIDEGIEMAKKYSTEKSGQFINGILDSVLIDLKKQNLIKKSGRGLQEQ
jgi:N utilization substance protein B